MTVSVTLDCVVLNHARMILSLFGSSWCHHYFYSFSMSAFLPSFLEYMIVSPIGRLCLSYFSQSGLRYAQYFKWVILHFLDYIGTLSWFVHCSHVLWPYFYWLPSRKLSFPSDLTMQRQTPLGTGSLTIGHHFISVNCLCVCKLLNPCTGD